LALRARQAGAKIWMLPKARVLHHGSGSLGFKSKTRMFFITRNRIWTKWKNYPFWTYLKSIPASLLCVLFSAVLWARRGYFLIWCKAHISAYLGLPKMLAKRNPAPRQEFERWLRKENFWKWIFYGRRT
jgi:GT2 family glycosyltransferase